MYKVIISAFLFYVNSLAFSQPTCSFTIEANDMMRYDLEHITISKSCTEVEVTLKHVGRLPKAAMGHNWVLTKTSDVQMISSEAIKAGPAGEYTPDSKSILAKTKLLGAGEEDKVKFKMSLLDTKESYTYFCTFPGHSSLMKGTLKFSK